MPNTTLTTDAVQLADQTIYRPKIVRLMNLSSVATGTSAISELMQTHKHRGMRLFYAADGLSTDSSVTITVYTGPTTTPAEVLVASSGSSGITLNATGRGTRAYCGLNRYTKVAVANAGDGECTGLAIDIELI